MAAGQVVLEEGEITFGEARMRRECLAEPRQVADVLVPHDERPIAERQPVLRHVGAAHAGDLDAHQRRIVRNRGKIQFPQLGSRRSYLYRGQGFFSHTLESGL